MKRRDGMPSPTGHNTTTGIISSHHILFFVYRTSWYTCHHYHNKQKKSKDECDEFIRKDHFTFTTREDFPRVGYRRLFRRSISFRPQFKCLSLIITIYYVPTHAYPHEISQSVLSRYSYQYRSPKTKASVLPSSCPFQHQRQERW